MQRGCTSRLLFCTNYGFQKCNYTSPFLPYPDIARETYREKLVKATKCETYTQYVFHWASVNEEMDSTLLEVDNGKLRAYIQTINRHITEGSSVDVTITAYMFPRNNASTNVTFNNTDFSEAVVAGEDTVSVTRDSDDWIELNVTEGFLDIWSSMPNNTEIQVILKAEVNCVEQKKVPINFVNPAEIPLEQENRRARHMDLQPLLVVFANNYESKKVLNREDEEEVMGEADNSTRSVIDIDNLNVRAKRSSNSECSLENYVVNLHNLGLANVVAPAELNISRCAGNCNNRLIINRLGTNHAKIMMAMYNAQISAGISADQATATAPCCVPTKYLVGYLLMNTHDNTVTMMRSYNKLIARECGCR